MDILVFLAGFGIGAVCVLIPAVIINRQTKNSQDSVKEQLRLYFETSANKIFEHSTNRLTEQNKEKLEEFFTRFRDRIENFEKLAKENIEKEAEHFNLFDRNIKSFLEAGNKISNDANILVNVMKSDNRTQGRWGEIILDRVLESSGLRKDIEYTTQRNAPEGRPDATVFLPDNRCVYIDSKTSFSSWDGYMNAQTDDEKSECLKAFTESTKSHITGLAKRDYSADEKSPDYVLMFIPIESCYSLLFCENCVLWDYAWKNNVMPVSPSTLLAALKIINAFYVTERKNKNAQEIAQLCSAMMDKFSSLLAEMIKAKTNIDDALKKLNGKGNILSQLEKIEELGVKGTKQLPSLPEDL